MADPPKVAFVASVYGDLSSFYIAYQPKDASVPLKKTSVVTIGPNDGRELSSANDIYGHYGDYLGRKDQFVTDGLVPNTEYAYQVIGKYKDGKEYKSPQLAFKTAPLPGLKMGLLTDEASQYGKTSIQFTGHSPSNFRLYLAISSAIQSDEYVTPYFVASSCSH